MSECIVVDARKVILDASQTISNRQRPSAQARSPESLGRAVVGAGTEEVQSSWPLRRHAKERSRGPISGHPQTVQRGRRPIAKAHLHWSFMNFLVRKTQILEIHEMTFFRVYLEEIFFPVV